MKTLVPLRNNGVTLLDQVRTEMDDMFQRSSVRRLSKRQKRPRLRPGHHELTFPKPTRPSSSKPTCRASIPKMSN